jgi:hypothetical protein
VSNAFFPEISPRSFRATELAKRLSIEGHEVIVYSKYRDYDYSSLINKYPIDLKTWGRAKLKPIPAWKGSLFSLIGRLLTRVLLLLFEYPGIEDMFRVRKVLKNEEGYDIMISFAVPYPVHWGVAWARRQNHRIADVWIADCGDPYMLDVNDSFKKLFYFSFFEKWFSRKADYITIPTGDLIKFYYREFHPKIRIVPQGFDFSEIIAIRDSRAYNKRNSIPTFAFAGSFIRTTRNPGPFLDYLAGLGTDFKFIIYTKSKGLILPYKKILGEKLEIRDYVPRNELLIELLKMDFLVNFGYDPQLQHPSKLIDYAITGKPVLNILKDFNREEVNEFLSGNYCAELVIRDIEQYDIKNVAEAFITLARENK